jgi:hypothetical protein
MKRLLPWIAAVAAVFLIAKIASAELFFLGESETTTDPLVRPRPITVVPVVEVSRLTAEIAKILERQRFLTESYDPKLSFFQAKRVDKQGSFDRVLIWAERDFEKPDDFFQIYLMYGRYEVIAMSKDRSYRLKMNEQLEERRIGSLRQDLLRLSSVLKEAR